MKFYMIHKTSFINQFKEDEDIVITKEPNEDSFTWSYPFMKQTLNRKLSIPNNNSMVWLWDEDTFKEISLFGYFGDEDSVSIVECNIDEKLTLKSDFDRWSVISCEIFNNRYEDMDFIINRFSFIFDEEYLIKEDIELGGDGSNFWWQYVTPTVKREDILSITEIRREDLDWSNFE